MHLSYLAAVTESFEMSRDAAIAGLVASPDNATLLNNLAFAHANLGEVREASNYLEKARLVADPDPSEVIMCTATEGLIAFRSHDTLKGRELYSKAFESAQSKGLRGQAGLAAAYWVQEELRALSTLDPKDIKRLVTAVQKSGQPSAEAVLARVADRLGPDSLSVLK
jgi:tetratricopeptide (TPR) repeat protein